MTMITGQMRFAVKNVYWSEIKSFSYNVEDIRVWGQLLSFLFHLFTERFTQVGIQK